MSGTHIVTGRIPLVRKRARWARTFSREVNGFTLRAAVVRRDVFDAMTNAFGYM